MQTQGIDSRYDSIHRYMDSQVPGLYHPTLLSICICFWICFFISFFNLQDIINYRGHILGVLLYPLFRHCIYSASAILWKPLNLTPLEVTLLGDQAHLIATIVFSSLLECDVQFSSLR